MHVIQRGNNRGPIFAGAADLAFFRECLAYSSRKHGVAIHAYVLMTNHIHLLVTPVHSASLPRMAQAVGRIYVQYFNREHTRTGTLWEGRYKAAIVDDERYLLMCMRYIEQNPVRANMVRRPDEYPWSSYRANARGASDDLVQPHPQYLSLGGSPAERRAAYRMLFLTAIPEEDLCMIRDSTQNGWALGAVAFRHTITAACRRSERLPLGRPRKAAA